MTVIARDYPDDPDYQKVQNYRELYGVLSYVIPDSKTQTEYSDYIIDRPIGLALENRTTLLEWVQGFHPEIFVPPVNPQQVMGVIWPYLYQVCQAYPHQPSFQTVLYYKNFFLGLQNTLPYGKYRKQYVDQFRALPVDRYLTTNQYLVWWVTRMFQQVENKNPSNDYTIEEGFVSQSWIPMVPLVLLGLLLIIR